MRIPAFWQPDEAAVTAFQNADLILMNGATYSKWADKVTLPESKVVDTSAVSPTTSLRSLMWSRTAMVLVDEHSHSGTAFTTWIDFKQATMQAQAVAAHSRSSGAGRQDSTMERTRSAQRRTGCPR
jgi:zinc transport system substrate-binding protein